MGNYLEPTDWGWEENQYLDPIRMVTPPAPDKLLKTIFCSCKTGCGPRCGSTRAGIICSPACEHSMGNDCESSKVSETEEIESVSEADTLLGLNLLLGRDKNDVNDIINEIFLWNEIENIEEEHRNDEVIVNINVFRAYYFYIFCNIFFKINYKKKPKL